MTFKTDLLLAAGAALILAFPAAALAQADQPPPTSPAGQPAPVPPADPVMSAPAAAPAAAQAPAADAAAGAVKEYPPCSATVTDSCVQRGAGSKAKGTKSSRRKRS